MTQGVNVIRSLELVAEKIGDPTEHVYATLFDRHPEMQDLFFFDEDGSVKGSMLQHVFEYIMDYLGENTIASNIIAASRLNHDGYGVIGSQFDEFFIALRDTLRVQLDGQWTLEMEAEWAKVLEEFAALV